MPIRFSGALVALLLAAGSARALSPHDAQRLRPSFEPNLGQAGAGVLILGHAGSRSFAVTPGAIEVVDPDVGAFRLRFAPAAAPSPSVEFEERLPGQSNYLHGRDPRGWVVGVPHYGRVRYRDIAPCVDLVLHGNGARVEYDLVLSPGTDPDALELTVEGALGIEPGRDGGLVLRGPRGDLEQLAPVVYQERDSTRVPIDSAFVLSGADSARFALGRRDPARELVIDPTLAFSTYFGGSYQDELDVVAVDPAGRVVVAGAALSSADFPLKDPLYPAPSSLWDLFVSKFDASGRNLLFSTYFGGSGPDFVIAIATGPDGSVHLLGTTGSQDLPVTAGVVGPSHHDPLDADPDCFVARLSGDGSALLYSTYLGGSGADCGGNGSGYSGGIAVDLSGYATVAASTSSTDFPTLRALQPSRRSPRDSFVARLDPAGSSFAYSTYLGNQGQTDAYGVAVDAAGSAVVAGYTWGPAFPLWRPLRSVGVEGEAFVTRLDPMGSFVYSTLLGGAYGDRAYSVALDDRGFAYVAGSTGSPDFPWVNAAFPPPRSLPQTFVTRLTPDGSALDYSSPVPGSPTSIAVDHWQHACIGGTSYESRLPVEEAIQPIHAGGGDAFVACLSSDGDDLVYASWLGGAGLDRANGSPADRTRIAFHPGGDLIVAGTTYSTDFPVTAGAFQPALNGTQCDGFISRIALGLGEDPRLRLRPRRGGDAGSVSLRVRGQRGARFASGATLRLLRPGEPDIPGEQVSVTADGRSLRATLDLRGARLGDWDVEVRNPDTTRYLERAAFAVEPGRGERPWVEIVGPTRERTGRVAAITIQYGNAGNQDTELEPLWLSGIPADAAIDLRPAPSAPPQLPGQPPLDWAGVPVHLSGPNGLAIPMLIPELPPGGRGTLTLALRLPSDRRLTLEARALRGLSGPGLRPEAEACWSALVAQAADAALRERFSIPLPASCAAGAGPLAAELFAALLSRARELPPDTPAGVDSALQALVALVASAGSCAEPAFAGLAPGTIEPFAARALAPLVDPARAPLACRGETLSLAEHALEFAAAYDPNEKLGPAGPGPERWQAGSRPLGYSIHFENLPAASAPAQQVVITDVLAGDVLDTASVELGAIGFGGRVIALPAGASAAALDVDLRPQQDLLVRIEAGLERLSGTLEWKLSALDPATGLPPADPLAGFLPPNRNSPEGQGFVTFSVMPKPGLPTAAAILNRAEIVFDANAPIATQEWSNSIDATPPASAVAALPAGVDCRFDVSWSGSDAGAGIRAFTVWVTQDGQPFAPWIVAAGPGSATFLGQAGSRYAFHSVAVDQVGNAEPSPALPDAETRVTSAGGPAPDSVGNTLRLARSGAELALRFGAAAGAEDHLVYSDEQPAGGFLREEAVVRDVAAGAVLPLPEQTRWYRAAGRSHCGVIGPR